MISLHNVQKYFNETHAVDDICLSIPSGTVFGLLGPNGAGKTTTIRMLVDIYRPDAGSIQIFGEPPGLKIQHRIGYLPEERGLYRKMNVLDQLIFLGELKKLSARQAKKCAMEYLEKFGLKEWAFKKVEQLSKGMQQKIQFIGTVLHDPDLLILDEPFSGLDPVNQSLLKEEILSFVKRGKTIIFSTHVLPQAEQLCQDICLIDHGKKVLEGKVSEIKQRFADPVYVLETDSLLENLTKEKTQVQKVNGKYEIKFEEKDYVEVYLLKLLQQGVKIVSFYPKSIDLESIFLKVVKR